MNAVDWRSRKSQHSTIYMSRFCTLYTDFLFCFFLPCSLLEGSVIEVSDQVLYQKVVLFFMAKKKYVLVII